MEEKVYDWKIPWAHEADAQEVGERLEWLTAKRGGSLVPRDLVEDSKIKSSPLHLEIEHDDSVAAEQWRLRQARGVMQNLTVEIMIHGDPEPKKVRAMIHVHSNPDGPGAYMPLETVLQSDSLREDMLKRAQAELIVFRTKYSILTELSSVFSVIEKVVEDGVSIS